MAEDLPLEFEITTSAAPVQAEGTVAGRPIYFRAGHDEWTFAVSESPGVDPADIDSPAAGRGWFPSGQLGRAWESRASYLTAEEAAGIIRGCAAAYIAERAT